MLLNRTTPQTTLMPSAPIPSGDRFRRTGRRTATRPLLLLASRSPRRIELLTQAGVDFVVAQPLLNDADLDPRGQSADRWVAAMAYLKAATALRQGLHTQVTPRRDVGVILGADTVVADGDEIIGQPRDESDARRIIEQLSNAEHDVLTGVAMLCPVTGRRELFVDRATVRVGSLDKASVDDYLASGQWRGKAGAYNLVERIAAGWPITFEGDSGTIMGLPVQLIIDRLDDWN
jgi:septum formation protein